MDRNNYLLAAVLLGVGLISGCNTDEDTDSGTGTKEGPNTAAGVDDPEPPDTSPPAEPDIDGTVDNLCQRAFECNALPSSFPSVRECDESISLCLDGLTASRQADWNLLIERCLELSVCSNFVSCYNSVPDC